MDESRQEAQFAAAKVSEKVTQIVAINVHVKLNDMSVCVANFSIVVDFSSEHSIEMLLHLAIVSL